MREWERDDGPEIRQHGQLQGAGALDWRAELASAGSSAWLVIAMAALRYGVVLQSALHPPYRWLPQGWLARGYAAGVIGPRCPPPF